MNVVPKNQNDPSVLLLDQIAVMTGLKEGDEVVSSGQLKLQNGSRVAVDNTILPSNDPNPRPVER